VRFEATRNGASYVIVVDENWSGRLPSTVYRMVAPAALEVKVTTTPPPCAAAAVMLGFADNGGPPQSTWHCVTTDPEPHPHNKPTDRKIAVPIALPACITTTPIDFFA